MKRRHVVAALLALGVQVLAPLGAQAQPGSGHDRLAFFGTHGSGPGQGIIAARFDPRTGALADAQLAAEIERPTWLVAGRDPNILYSVSETGNDGKSQASVHALRADAATGKLAVLSTVASGGGGATHLAFDAASRTLFVANFGTGQVSAIPVLASGGLGPVASVQADSGSGPTRRQTGPHAHGVLVAPGGRYLLVTDLGADRIFVYRFDPKTRSLSPNDPPFVAASPGSGPRHALFSRDGRFVYANSELTGELTVYRWDGGGGRLTPLQTISTQAPTYTGQRSSADIAASRDGRFLYVSNRGEDSLVVYRLDQASGLPTEVQRLPSGGQVPWSFALDPSGRWLLVANETSSTVTVFHVDPSSGRLTATGQPLAVPKPTSVCFVQP